MQHISSFNGIYTAKDCLRLILEQYHNEAVSDLTFVFTLLNEFDKLIEKLNNQNKKKLFKIASSVKIH